MSLIKNKSRYFRHVYSNGFGMQAGGNEIVVSFGFKENPQGTDDDTINEVAVVMLPATVKLLAQSLTKLVEFVERSSGTEIPFDSAKLAALENALNDAIASATLASQLPS